MPLHGKKTTTSANAGAFQRMRFSRNAARIARAKSTIVILIGQAGAKSARSTAKFTPFITYATATAPVRMISSRQMTTLVKGIQRRMRMASSVMKAGTLAPGPSPRERGEGNCETNASATTMAIASRRVGSSKKTFSATISSGTPIATHGRHTDNATITTARNGRARSIGVPNATAKKHAIAAAIAAPIAIRSVRLSGTQRCLRRIPHEIGIEAFERLRRDRRVIDQPRIALQPHVVQLRAGERERHLDRDPASRQHVHRRPHFAEQSTCRDRGHDAGAAGEGLRFDAALVRPHLDRSRVAHHDEIHVRAGRRQIAMRPDRAPQRLDLLRPQLASKKDHVMRHADRDETPLDARAADLERFPRFESAWRRQRE